jgi:hypothetical protein
MIKKKIYDELIYSSKELLRFILFYLNNDLLQLYQSITLILANIYQLPKKTQKI